MTQKRAAFVLQLVAFARQAGLAEAPVEEIYGKFV
eukprot:COSAG06_NODE_68976_length_199_cov_87.300000_1_plen_34_part_10